MCGGMVGYLDNKRDTGHQQPDIGSNERGIPGKSMVLSGG